MGWVGLGAERGKIFILLFYLPFLLSSIVYLLAILWSLLFYVEWLVEGEGEAKENTSDGVG